MFRFLSVLSVLSVLALVGLAGADEKKGKGKGNGKRGFPSAEEIFKKMDKNGDGKVTLEEYKAFHEEMRAKMKERFDKAKEKRKDKGKGRFGSAEERFKQIDTNNDGSISLEELKKAHESRRHGKGGADKKPGEKKDK